MLIVNEFYVNMNFFFNLWVGIGGDEERIHPLWAEVEFLGFGESELLQMDDHEGEQNQTRDDQGESPGVGFDHGERLGLVGTDEGHPRVEESGEQQVALDREHERSPGHGMVKEISVGVEILCAGVDVDVTDGVYDEVHDEEQRGPGKACAVAGDAELLGGKIVMQISMKKQ